MKIFYYIILVYLGSAFFTNFYSQINTKSTTEPPISSLVEAWQKLSITQSPPKEPTFDLQKTNSIDTLIITPKKEDWWTGHVYELLKTYTDVNGEITVGSSALGSKYHGYAKFDISSIPLNAKILNVQMVVFTTTVSNSPSHSFYIRKLDVDPQIVRGFDLFYEIESGRTFLSANSVAMQSPGYHVLTLNFFAIHDLQYRLEKGWWAVGFQELDDDDGFGVFAGWNWGGFIPFPYLAVTYTVALPDLVVWDPITPSSAHLGESISISCTVRNIGDGRAPASICYYYLSSDCDGSQKIPLGYNSVAALESFKESKKENNVTIPDNITPGSYYILFNADAADWVGESDEGNNVTCAGTIEILNDIPDSPTNIQTTINSNSQINLTWDDNSDNEDGFKIERRTGTKSFTEIAVLPENTTSFEDTGLNPDTAYCYIVRAFNNGGNSEYSIESCHQITGIIDLISNIPGEYRLHQNYPNPFNPSTHIQFEIAGQVNVRLNVYDILGRTVATLVDKEMTPGKYNLVFDANDLPAGIYYYKIQAGKYSQTNKMILLK